MKKLLEFLITSLAEKPEKVKIREQTQDELVTLTCKVDKEDMGKIIGKEGKVVKAIRNLLRTKAGREGKKVFFALEETSNKEEIKK